jgi:PKD repeat protein
MQRAWASTTLLFAVIGAAILGLSLAPLPSSVVSHGTAALAAPRGTIGAVAHEPSRLVPHPTATPTWTDLTATAGMPPPRLDGGLVYDGEDGYTILFGGTHYNSTRGAYQWYNDTWKFYQGVWSNITSTAGAAPSPREGFGITFDPNYGSVVLFGGRTAQGAILNDTWQFVGGSWRNISSTPSPPARQWPSFSFDAGQNYDLLFGGASTSIIALNDTWSFSFGVWTKQTPAHTPTPRWGASLINDPPTKSATLFGGLDAVNYRNDTWNWTGTDWQVYGPSTIPDARLGAGFAYDAAAGLGVMYGGHPANTYPSGTWTWSTENWTLFNNLPGSPPSGTVWNQFTYDANDQWVVYEVPELSETYVFNFTTATASFAPQFSLTPTSGLAPLTVNGTASATGGTPPYNFTWSTATLGDRYGSPISYVFSTAGNFTVELRAADAANAVRFFNTTIAVTTVTPPHPVVTFSTSPACPCSVGSLISFIPHFVVAGTPPYTYSWTFGDGGTSTVNVSQHTYARPGNFPVSLAVQDQYYRVYSNQTLPVEALVPLSISATLTPTQGTAPLPVSGNVTATGGVAPYTYAWSWGDGSPAGATALATHTFASAGSYTVKITVVDLHGSNANQSWTVTVAAAPVALALTISASATSVVVGQNLSFSSVVTGGTAPYTYAWTFGDTGTATIADPTHAFAAAGTFTVTLTVTDAHGASATQSLVVSVANPNTPGAKASGFVIPWIPIALLLVIVILLLIVLLYRRRRKKPVREETVTTTSSP